MIPLTKRDPILVLDAILKIKSDEEFIKEAKRFANFIIKQEKESKFPFRTQDFQKNVYVIYRLAKKLEDFGVAIRKLESFVAESQDPYFIIRFAKDFKKPNIKKLQDAMISTGDIVYIAKFAVYIKGIDKNLIEKIIAKSKNAKAAYLYVRYVRGCNVHKLKHILLKSKRPRYLFTLAMALKSKKELLIIQDLIINSGSNTYIRMFAQYIKHADIQKLENKVIQIGNIDDMKKFARVVKSPRLSKLSLLF